MLEAFKRYVSNYNLNDMNIKLKYNHSLRVMDLMVKYATMLNYSDEEIELARIIGLLHDIGRFEQLKVYHTYDDLKSINHALYSVQQLFDKGEIKLFTDKEEWYPIIRFAILNHNKKEIDECSDERTLRLAKLIRDIDKLDIIYLIGVLNELDYQITDEPITKQVRDSVFKHETADKKYKNNINDAIVLHFAFVFDIYNDIILSKFKEYLEVYYERLNDNDRLLDIYQEVMKYINERVDNYERNRDKV